MHLQLTSVSVVFEHGEAFAQIRAMIRLHTKIEMITKRSKMLSSSGVVLVQISRSYLLLSEFLHPFLILRSLSLLNRTTQIPY